MDWLERYYEAPNLAVRHLERRHPHVYHRLQTAWRPDTVCNKWAQVALNAGFTKSQWYEPIARIMYAESRCYSFAYNPNSNGPYGHARGLMQIMDGLWPGPCGITARGLYDPLKNLKCAKHVYEEQGWNAWATY